MNMIFRWAWSDERRGLSELGRGRPGWRRIWVPSNPIDHCEFDDPPRFMEMWMSGWICQKFRAEWNSGHDLRANGRPGGLVPKSQSKECKSQSISSWVHDRGHWSGPSWPHHTVTADPNYQRLISFFALHSLVHCIISSSKPDYSKGKRVSYDAWSDDPRDPSRANLVQRLTLTLLESLSLATITYDLLAFLLDRNSVTLCVRSFAGRTMLCNIIVLILGPLWPSRNQLKYRALLCRYGLPRTWHKNGTQ